MKSPILGSSYVARSVNAADNRMVNLFPEIVPEGGKEPAFLQRTPGIVSKIGGLAGPVVGLHVVNGLLLIAAGSTLYTSSAPYTSATNIGSIVSASRPFFADDGDNVFIANGADSYNYKISTNTLTKITDPDFPGALTVTYLNGWFVFNPGGTSDQIWATRDPLVIDPLIYDNAVDSPDGVVAVFAIHGELWVFGYNSVEVWFDAGQPGFTFTPNKGAYMEVGCSTRYSIAKLDNSLFWVGSNPQGGGVIYRSRGYSAERVSTHAIEWVMQQYPANAILGSQAFSYQQEGHGFYVVSFPNGSNAGTWAYDVATQAWHERAAYSGGDFSDYRVECATSVQAASLTKGFTFVGYQDSSALFYFDLDVYTNNSQPGKWLRSWRALPTGQNSLKRTVQHSLELDFGYDATNNVDVDVRFSDDGGNTWSVARTVSRAAGETTRLIWHRLGMTTKLRDRVYEVSGVSDAPAYIMGAELILSPTNG